MDTKMWRRVAPVALMGLGLAMPFTGCGEDGLVGDLAEQCGLVCAAEGVVEGNASISGIPKIDAFFGAVIDFSGAANGVNANIRAQLDAMAASLGLQAGATGAEIKAALEAKITANVDGGLSIGFKEPACQASVEVTAKAAAECDVDVDPGSVEVKCEGTCTIDASAQASCTGEATLKCKGQAPNLACEGTCSGDCSLEVAATCEGVCRGTCSAGCTVMDAAGNCKGSCTGTCQGTCELKAGGSCSGKCEGSCEYTPPSGTCDATAEARCEGAAKADVKCKGGCEGKATPPSVSADCKATVEAKAEASIECTPPELDIKFQFKAGLDATAQGQFLGFLGTFRGQFSAMIAAAAKADVLVDSGANLVAAGEGAVKATVDQLSGEADLKASIGAACALGELGAVGTVIGEATTGLQGSLSAFAEITSVVGG
ncbi:MAG: hypothetical protein WKG00_35055 [Polyangiaceae bacterium]